MVINDRFGALFLFLCHAKHLVQHTGLQDSGTLTTTHLLLMHIQKEKQQEVTIL